MSMRSWSIFKKTLLAMTVLFFVLSLWGAIVVETCDAIHDDETRCEGLAAGTFTLNIGSGFLDMIYEVDSNMNNYLLYVISIAVATVYGLIIGAISGGILQLFDRKGSSV